MMKKKSNGLVRLRDQMERAEEREKDREGGREISDLWSVIIVCQCERTVSYS